MGHGPRSDTTPYYPYLNFGRTSILESQNVFTKPYTCLMTFNTVSEVTVLFRVSFNSKVE